MKPDLKRLVPPGYEPKPEIDLFIWGSALCTLYSFSFFFRLEDAIRGLYLHRGRGHTPVLYEHAVMPSYASLIGGWPMLFLSLLVIALAFVPVHYAYHYRHSKSILLMRRLPNRMELHRRCTALPLIHAGLILFTVLLLLHLYLVIYLLAVPDVCLTSGQWQKIWSVLP